MTVGESIRQYRTAQGMSQGDLADALDVSRQSVSKWENDQAVPELDKLVSMAELFGVTLDALVKGMRDSGDASPAEDPEDALEQELEGEEEAVETAPPAAQSSLHNRKNTKQISQGQRITGTILLCTGALIFVLLFLFGGAGAWFGALLFSSPFFLCGILCHTVRRLPGLWCGWGIYGLVYMYLQYATGLRIPIIFRRIYYSPSMGYPGQLLIAWILFILLLGLVVLTLVLYRRDLLPLTKRSGITLLWLGVGIFAFRLVSYGVGKWMIAYLANGTYQKYEVQLELLQFLNILLSVGHIALSLTALILGFAILRGVLAQKKARKK